MRIYLVRHGETKWNTEGRIQGWKNSDLTNKGIEDAKALGRYLSGVDFKCAYSSPFKRAIDTTRCIIDEKDVELNINFDFRELNFGSWEGRVFEEVKLEYPEEHYNLWNRPSRYKPIDGENLEQFRKRVGNGLNTIKASNYEGNILLVTHALVVKAIYNIARSLALEKIWDTPRIGNASLTILDLNKETGEIKIVQEATTKYLDAELV